MDCMALVAIWAQVPCTEPESQNPPTHTSRPMRDSRRLQRQKRSAHSSSHSVNLLII